MADINVLMMGGRRAGKTSVLAAMDQCCHDLLDTIPDLSVRCIEGGVGLSTKQGELEHYFGTKYMKQNMFTADIGPTTSKDTYTYEINVNNRDTGYTLNFMDFPGEWLSPPQEGESSDITEGRKKLPGMFDRSQVIIITIDTPHMVENISEATSVGECHYEFNRVSEITRFFKNAFQNSKQERMVLFVPLKCEKYYYRNKMKLVSETLKTGYSELLSFLANDEIKDLCTVGIVPILTIGGAEFFKFNNNGYAGIYSYVEDLSLRKYIPKYCEQPLIFTLNYLIKMTERNKLQQGKISRWFRETFKNAAKLNDLVNCKTSLENLIETNIEKGFEILQNPLGMEVK